MAQLLFYYPIFPIKNLKMLWWSFLPMNHNVDLQYYSRILELTPMSGLDREHTLEAKLLRTEPAHFW
jgi:hypothetical protein